MQYIYTVNKKRIASDAKSLSTKILSSQTFQTSNIGNNVTVSVHKKFKKFLLFIFFYFTKLSAQSNLSILLFTPILPVCCM